jgi:hypothetical protein
MFTEVAAADALARVRGHDFGADPVLEVGANRVDAIVALDRLIAAAHAEQASQIAALHAERAAVLGLGRGDPTLSVIGEVAMARNIGPTAASSQVVTALGLRRLPAVAALFDHGVISSSVVRAVVIESSALHLDDQVVLDGEIAPLLPGLTTARARQATARAVIRIDADAARVRADQRVAMFPDTDGGPTVLANGQGLCSRSHTIKSQPGWTVTTHGKATIWTTPTGHTYRSDPPPLLPRDGPGHLRQ